MTSSSTDPLVATLLAARHAIDAALAYLDAAQPVACPHANREDLTTFAGEHWICRDCGYEYEEGADAHDE